MSAIQPFLGRLGSFVGSFAAGAASTISWIVIILLISYFLLAESEGISHAILNIDIEGYSNDLKHTNEEISRIWSAFMRGQILIVLILLGLYSATLGILDVQFFFGLVFDCLHWAAHPLCRRVGSRGYPSVWSRFFKAKSHLTCLPEFT